MEQEEYQKYRWFYTKSDKLVIGGKSAEQNDHILKELISKNKDYIVMHTNSPGSPFIIILSDVNKVTETDMEQAAIFTASFSRAWKNKKKKEKVDIFNLSSLYKLPNMKTGTWGVKGKFKSLIVPLKLFVTIQKGNLRAVPEKTIKSMKDVIFKITPGSTDKQKMIPKLSVLLPSGISYDEILQALPSGGITIKNDN